MSTTPPGVKSQGTAATSGYQEVWGCWWPPGVCFHRQRRWNGYSIERPAMHRERNIFMTQRLQEAALNQVAGFLVNFTGLVSAAHVGFGNWWVWGVTGFLPTPSNCRLVELSSNKELVFQAEALDGRISSWHGSSNDVHCMFFCSAFLACQGVQHSIHA